MAPHNNRGSQPSPAGAAAASDAEAQRASQQREVAALLAAGRVTLGQRGRAAGSGGTPTATIYPNSVSTGSGSLFTVFNSSGTPINIYGGYLDAINNGAAGAGVTLPPGQTGLFIDEAVNQWAFFVSGRNESINAQSGTTYTLAATDQNALVQITNASGITLTLPNSFPAGFTCNVEQGGAGQITCSAASGGSLVGWKTAGAATGASKTAGEYAIVSLRVTANSTGTAAVWNISGQTA